jgi:hypothetical protein
MKRMFLGLSMMAAYNQHIINGNVKINDNVYTDFEVVETPPRKWNNQSGTLP